MRKTALLAPVLMLSMNVGWAGLGSAPASLGAHAIAEQSRPGSSGLASYTDRQTTLESGTVVHQYVDDQGTVFAVSWSGPYPPDLKEILGSHFDAMVAQAGKGGRARSISVQQPDLVIVSDGHMGAFEGQAWLPGKLPAGFKPGDIK